MINLLKTEEKNSLPRAINEVYDRTKNLLSKIKALVTRITALESRVSVTTVFSGNWTIYEYSNKRWVGYYLQAITNASIATAWGNIYRSGEINITLPPSKYVWNGYTQASVGATGDTRPLCWAAKSWSGTFFICSGTVTAAQNYTLYVMAQGAWT